MDVFVARQPIFDKEKNIYAYELLFRSGETDGFPDIDGDTATTSILSSSFFTVGIKKIGAGKLVFINFTEQLLKKGTPKLFPPEYLVVEVLEDVTPDEEVVDACLELKERGFILALDDFVYAEKFTSLISLSDIIKLDFRLTPKDQIREMVAVLSQYECRLLAEKVETYEEFNLAVELGFEYFQGYFFSKPELLKNKDLPPSQLGLLQLISTVNDPDFDIDKLEKLVSQDVSITYKLLNFINSSHFSRVQPISSVRQAISFLGQKEFQLFVTLIATSKLAENKPAELIRSSIIRARFLANVGSALGQDTKELFLLGLFSQIDAMLDQSIDSILKKLPLSNDISMALVQRKGALFPFIQLVENYQRCNWAGFRTTQLKLGLGDEVVTPAFMDAIAWADSI